MKESVNVNLYRYKQHPTLSPKYDLMNVYMCYTFREQSYRKYTIRPIKRTH